jgi:hypothetical protein
MNTQFATIIVLLSMPTVASAADQPISCVKVAECAQQLVTIANRLLDENRLLMERVKALETIRQSVVAFDADSCPLGWTPYKEGEGRFIRGVVQGSPRVRGSTEDDAFQGFTFGDGSNHFFKFSPIEHSTAQPNGWSDMFDAGIYGVNGSYQPNDPPRAQIVSDGSHGTPRVADETRPKNVALLYCRKD